MLPRCVTLFLCVPVQGLYTSVVLQLEGPTSRYSILEKETGVTEVTRGNQDVLRGWYYKRGGSRSHVSLGHCAYPPDPRFPHMDGVVPL